MKVHTLVIDSSTRQANLYLHANTYVITLDTPIYDVSQVKLVSARIPTPQLDSCSTNKIFSVDGTNITLDEQNYASGTALASALQTKLAPPTTNIDTVSFSTTTNQLTFSNTHVSSNPFTIEFETGTNGYEAYTNSNTTPHQLMGFASNNYASSGDVITSGAINLNGPNSLVIRITAGSDEFTQSIYTHTPFYTGHLILDGTDFINIKGVDDPFVHRFHSGTQKYVKDIKLEFFYMSHGRLVPYDFMNQDHVLKFEIECSKDKLENLPKQDIPEKKDEPLVSIPKILENPYDWDSVVYIGISVVFLLVMVNLLRMKI